ncbi:acyl-coenzyme A synthetase ACSM3, mitochondrial-like isoform X1 [Pantherophis guttatus]|uniref:medium-chain acyl-CoA ligase n=1 Tax=Pantherophis guttatus TaxID=94885 RepID=A0A6P9CGW3_PANGU|nr:acyl-coenzyme A synthetase ACSM3, mitochondrial-like isoform X1 [Pantherophis guttatus]XP_034282150.1 acyl-coenzyme A synthetase ACSM3, mitochondrial-like isoform X1 [Pantherophis guttatus]
MVGAMKFLSRLPRLQAAGLPTFPCRFNSQTTHAFTSLANLDSEPRDRDLPEYFNFASDVLDKWSQREKEGKRPSNPALWWVTENDEEVKWTFEELSYLSRKTATVLSEACNLRKGDRLLMILPRVPEWWLLSLACIRTGIVFIPATILLTAPDILYRLQQSKVSCIVANEATAPFVDAVGSECSWLKTRILVSKTSKREGWLNFHDLLQAASDRHQPVQTKSLDPMTIYFTSGTMGYPKMVQHSQGSLGFGLATTAREWMGLTSSDIIWGLSDPGWIKFAVGSFYSPWSQGSCIFQHGFLQFDPKVVLETLAKYPVTTFCGTPTIFRMLLQHDVSRYKFKSLQTCLSGGEPSNLEELKVWKEETGLDIHEGYGQTESSILCSTGKGMKIKPGFIGKPLSGVDLQIIDENNNRLPPGEEGDIAVKIKPQKPVGLFSGYVNDPEKTAGTERGDYYITGDRGLMDEDGYVQFTARADDIILSSGYRIGPFEVEHALMKHPAVAEAAVVSSPDPIRGEVVKAFIILTPAYQSQDREKLSVELQGHVKKITAPYKYPRKIEFVQDLPKTISGKIQKRLLRKKEWEKD